MKKLADPPPPKRPSIEFASAKSAVRAMRKNKPVFCVIPKFHVQDSSSIDPTSSVSSISASSTKGLQAQLMQMEQSIFRDFESVFSDRLHAPSDDLPVQHRIDEVPGSKPVARPQYRMSLVEREALNAYLDEMLELGLIRPSLSAYSSPILMIPKEGRPGEFRVVHDFRMLNKQSLADQYLMPNQLDLFDSMRDSTIFSVCDLKSGFFQQKLLPEHAHKTAFKCHRGSFEYVCMPQGLRNASSSFMRLMDHILKDFIGVSVCLYVDDVCIHSKNVEQHDKDVRAVLSTLQRHGLVLSKSKSKFFRQSVSFLGHTISHNCISVDQSKLQVIKDFPRLQTVGQLRSTLGFFSYLRRHIRQFSSLAAPLIRATAKSSDSESRDNVDYPGARRSSDPLSWSPDMDAAFSSLKKAALSSEALLIPDRRKPFIVECDGSTTALGAILWQKDDKSNRILPVAFMSRRLPERKRQWAPRDIELESLVAALGEFRSYVLGVPFEVWVDHLSLQYIHSQRQLTGRVARAYDVLSEYEFTVKYKPGSSNRADGLSRISVGPEAKQFSSRDDMATLSVAAHEDTHLSPSLVAPVSLSSMKINCDDDLLSEITSAYDADPQVVAWIAQAKSASSPKAKYQLLDNILVRRSKDSARVVVPMKDALRTKILKQFHESPLLAHGGVAKTLHLLSHRFYWPHMARDCQQYIASCGLCAANKPSTKSPPGLLQPMPIPNYPFEQISMDFVGPFTPSASGNKYILVIVDRLTRWVTMIPAPSFDAAGAADAIYDHIITKHGCPKVICLDRDSRWCSDLFKHFANRIQSKVNMSTSRHPQTDGLSERYIQSALARLRIGADYDMRNWDTLVPGVAHALNVTFQASIGMSPFRALYGFDPRLPMDGDTSPVPTDRISNLEKIRRDVQSNLFDAQSRQSAYANKHRSDVSFDVGDMVYLKASNVRDDIESFRPGNKLRSIYLGPYKIVEKRNPVVCKLDLPVSMSRLHPVFHISVLKKAVPSPVRFATRNTNVSSPLLPDHPDLYEVDRILATRYVGRGKSRHREALVSWKGYSKEHNSWVHFDNIQESTSFYKKAKQQLALAKVIPSQSASDPPIDVPKISASLSSRSARIRKPPSRFES